jgi:hypothetical protein
VRDAIVISPKVFRKAIRITVRLLLALGCGVAITFLDPAIPPRMLPTRLANNRRTRSVAESVLAAELLPLPPGKQDPLPQLDPPPNTEEKALPNPPPQELPAPTLLASNLMAKSVEEGVLTALGPTSAQRKPLPRPAPPAPRPQEKVSPNVPQKLSTPPSNGPTPSVAQPILAASASITPTPHQEPIAQPAPPSLTPEQAPPKPAQVSYEAGQLTIVAENSTLSDILSQVHARMGADIDLPASASGERIWVQLGPGPARKVLASLLGGTTLDYVIQASDSEADPDGIRSVLLSPRTSAPAVARAITPAARPLPPRLSDTERSRAILNRIAPEARTAPEETVTPEPAVSTDVPPATPLTPAAAQTPATQQTPGAPQAPAAPQTPATPPSAPATDAVATSETQAPDPNKPPVNDKGDMMQTLQNMYEQRKQMQLARTPSSPN